MKIKPLIYKVFSKLSLLVFLMQCLLIVVSWMITAMYSWMPIRSLLGSEGLRWLFGSFTDNICSHLLIWILLCGMAIGLVMKSKIHKAIINYNTLNYYERMALFLVMWETVVLMAIIILLAFVPHAVLLSALGTLLPSSFSVSLIPLSAISLGFMAITYGCIVGIFRTIENIFKAMTFGVNIVAPLLVLYVIASELFYSIKWVLCL